MQVYLKIELGNAAMETRADVARAIAAAARRIREGDRVQQPPRHGDGFRILDDNGNSVGSVEFLE